MLINAIVSLANWYSGCHWKIKKSAAVLVPPIVLDVDDIEGLARCIGCNL